MRLAENAAKCLGSCLAPIKLHDPRMFNWADFAEQRDQGVFAMKPLMQLPLMQLRGYLGRGAERKAEDSWSCT